MVGIPASLSPRFIIHFLSVPGLASNRMSLDSIAGKDDGGGGDNWSYNTCKAPVKSQQTNNQLFTGHMPNQQCQSTVEQPVTVAEHVVTTFPEQAR